MATKGKQRAAKPRASKHKPELAIVQNLRRIIRAVDLHSRKLTSLYGVTGPQLVCLVTLCGTGPVTSAELSRKVFVSASTITGIIDRLERLGYVERRRDLVDRRRVLLQPTTAGYTLAQHAPSPMQDQLIEGLSKLPAAEQTAIGDALQRIVDLMEARDVDAAPILATGEIQPAGSGRFTSIKLNKDSPGARHRN